MEGGERSHPQRSGGAGEFFICFSSRLSSSSAASSASAAMRVPSSKAHMSPGRGRDPGLSSSLTRRLRSSGSLKGAQSPMFPPGVQLTGRKKGCVFEAAEPSSPKVTCIGQVRVKAKNKGKSHGNTAMERSRSRRAGAGGEASFRREETGRNQGWVHQLPLSICEALREIGSDFNCFLPCGGGSICCGAGGSRAGEEKKMGKKRMTRSGSSSSCGAMLARWLMAVDEREEGVKRGDAMEEREKVGGFFLSEWEEKVGEVEVEEMGNSGGEEGEIVVLGENVEDGEEAAAMVSVCIPPKNALLLMRCRSDPVRMASLTNHFWGSPATRPQCEEEQMEEEEELELHGHVQVIGKDDEKHLLEKAEIEASEVSVKTGEIVNEEGCCEKSSGEEQETLIEEQLQLLKEVQITRAELSCGSALDVPVSLSKDETREETNTTQLQEEQENKEVRKNRSHQSVMERQMAEEETKRGRPREERRFGSICASRSKERVRKPRRKEKDSRRHSFSSERDTRRHSLSSEREARRASFSVERGKRWSFSMEKDELTPKEEKAIALSAPVDGVEASGEAECDKPCCTVQTQASGEKEQEAEEVEEEKKELPDCLLMMMHEPKLSIEVSKETWVCGNDFVRNRCPSKSDDGEVNETTQEVVPSVQPAAAVAAIQEKLALTQYEPFVLTRCKSEPVRSSARLAPDACFWKDRHRPIGAAGLGF